MGNCLLSTLLCSMSLCLFTQSEAQQSPSNCLRNFQLRSKSQFSLHVGAYLSRAATLEPTMGHIRPSPLTTPHLLERRQQAFSVDQGKKGWMQD